jgi:hypothetical protein
MRLFFGIATAGWAIGILAQTLAAEWGTGLSRRRRRHGPGPHVRRCARRGLDLSLGLPDREAGPRPQQACGVNSFTVVLRRTVMPRTVT